MVGSSSLSAFTIFRYLLPIPIAVYEVPGRTARWPNPRCAREPISDSRPAFHYSADTLVSIGED